MKSHVKDLIEVTDRIAAVYADFLLLLREEKDILMQHRLDELVECVKKKETIALKMNMLEESRKSIVEKLALMLEVKESDVTMAILSKRIDEPYSSEIIGIQTRISLLLREIMKLCRENQLFIEHSIDGIKRSFGFFDDITTPDKTYVNSGAITKNGAAGRVVCQEA